MSLPIPRRLGVRLLKILAAIIVFAALGRHVFRTWSDLRAHHEVITFDPVWILLAVVFYLAGLICQGLFFDRVLAGGDVLVGSFPAVRAYMISHLAKYVPGKAMVVLVRVGLVVVFGGIKSTAAIATFYETLVMMAAGGLLGAVGFAVARAFSLAGLSLALGVAFLIVVLPAVFPRVARLASKPFRGVGPETHPRITNRLLAEGLALSTAGWILLGSSLFATTRGASTGVVVGLADMPVLVAASALATVGGFVVAIAPGGLGIREGILIVALKPTLGPDGSVVAALALRLSWVAAELIAAAVLWFVARPPKSTDLADEVAVEVLASARFETAVDAAPTVIDKTS